ncbi:hypothetical protein NLI96_g12355 [Meripilus lineatus]|uniref:Cytochrome P450 n=1 Tax=Meripilus lineatus TaxID=2056292 RepID=A0AAD5URQ7_9APHY|nr:hypothetical protein NLI96_g12355 [Physisporinus lineatus]
MIVILAFFLIALSVILLLYATRAKSDFPYPPSPPADPVIGHARFISTCSRDDAYHALAQKYGEIVYLNVLGKSIVLLNSEKVADDLLDKRSTIYSDRPRLPLVKMMGSEDALGFMAYGNKFFKMRKILHDHLASKKVVVFEDIQASQSHVLLRNLMSSPERFMDHAKRYATAVVLQIAYGHEITSDEDPFLQNAHALDRLFARFVNAGSSAVDFFPALRHLPSWFPGAWFVRFAKGNANHIVPHHLGILNPFIEARVVIEENRDRGFVVVQEDMKTGNAPLSFVSLHLEELIREKKDSPKELHRLKWAALQLYGAEGFPAGAETTCGSLEVFFLAMVLYPEAQHKAHRELDSVLGHGQLPTFGDRDSLPFLECLVQEVLSRTFWYSQSLFASYIDPALTTRLKPGALHRLMQDDIYNGMFIPKGSIVVPNIGYMMRDEKVYHESNIFKPERFLPRPDGCGEPLPRATFGFGRRICPGRHLAVSELWIAIASILAVFDILPVQDDRGNDLPPKEEFHHGLTRIASEVGDYQSTESTGDLHSAGIWSYGLDAMNQAIVVLSTP